MHPVLLLLLAAFAQLDKGTVQKDEVAQLDDDDGDDPAAAVQACPVYEKTWQIWPATGAPNTAVELRAASIVSMSRTTSRILKGVQRRETMDEVSSEVASLSFVQNFAVEEFGDF